MYSFSTNQQHPESPPVYSNSPTVQARLEELQPRAHPEQTPSAHTVSSETLLRAPPTSPNPSKEEHTDPLRQQGADSRWDRWSDLRKVRLCPVCKERGKTAYITLKNNWRCARLHRSRRFCWYCGFDSEDAARAGDEPCLDCGMDDDEYVIFGAPPGSDLTEEDVMRVELHRRMMRIDPLLQRESLQERVEKWRQDVARETAEGGTDEDEGRQKML